VRVRVRLSRNRSGIGPALLVLALALVLGACAGRGASGPDPEGLRVVTTTTVFADIVDHVGGDRVAVTSIIPSGVGPEDFEPKPDDARKLADAQLVVSNGVGLDDFLDRLIASAGEAPPRLVLGDGIATLTVDGEENPHFWLDPTLVRQFYLPAIAAKLTELDPDGREEYEANTESYGTELDALDAELKDELAQIPAGNRKLVTFHDAFPYFARHYDFELIGVILANVGQEPTASELAELVEKVRNAGVTAVFSEAQFSPKLTQTLADEAGIRKVVTTLYNDALGPPPADSYLGLLRWDVDQIVAALR
jgi:ABC-type Zn uptake system ZnuABC Zn-binding protein ZnuA